MANDFNAIRQTLYESSTIIQVLRYCSITRANGTSWQPEPKASAIDKGAGVPESIGKSFTGSGNRNKLLLGCF
jgi:hypothetical protein